MAEGMHREPAQEDLLFSTEAFDFRALVEGLVHSLPEGLVVVEAPEGRIVAISDFGRRLLRACDQVFGSGTAASSESCQVYRADGTGPISVGDLPLTRAVRGEVVVDEPLVLRVPAGEDIHVVCSAAPIYGKTGGVRWAVSTWRDITTSRQAEEALRENEARLRRAQEVGGIGDWEWDIQSDTANWSLSLRKLLNLDPAFEPAGRSFFEFIYPEDRPLAEAAVEALLERNEPIDIELRMLLRDGSLRWLASRGSLERDAEGRPRRIVGVNFDITARKAAEAALQQERQRTLAHKEALLQEANHRIKNNLAMTASMLGMQARATTNPEAKQHLQDAGARIVVLGHLYEHLGGFSDDRVEAADYLAKLTRCLQETLSQDGSEVRVSFTAERCMLSAGAATDLGLICNELVTNAAKYGRSADGSCSVSVAFSSDGEMAAFRVQDRGAGLPEGFDLGRATSLGLRLVKRLADHLNGSLAFQTLSPGVCFEVRFPVADADCSRAR